MSTWRRRIRGAIGMGVAWAVAWFGAGMVLLLIIGPGAADVPFPLFFGLLGFLAGATFSFILGIAEGRRRFEEMSLPRFTVWGAVGGVLLAVVVSLVALAGDPVREIMGLGSLFALAGAGSAAGSLTLARIAGRGGKLSDRGERDLLEGG